MTTYYLGSGGSDVAAGTSWGARWATDSKAKATAVAGDTVYYGPGAYHVAFVGPTNNGSSGNPINWIGDYTGANTDGVGGVVRFTACASGNQTRGSGNWSTWTSKSWHVIQGFTFDGGGSSGALLYFATACNNIIIERCHIEASPSGWGVYVDGASQAAITVRRCYFQLPANGTGVLFTHTVAVSDAGHVVDRCVFDGAHGGFGVTATRIGGATVRNSISRGCQTGFRVSAALTVGQLMTVNNCIVHGCNVGLSATTTAEFVEDYNDLSTNSTARSNVTAGANSVAYPWLTDTRWLHAASNAVKLVTPFDAAPYSALVELNSGTGASSTDLRGTAVQGGFLEWGALEYDSNVAVEAGGGVTMWPLSNGFIQTIMGGGV